MPKWVISRVNNMGSTEGMLWTNLGSIDFSDPNNNNNLPVYTNDDDYSTFVLDDIDNNWEVFDDNNTGTDFSHPPPLQMHNSHDISSSLAPTDSSIPPNSITMP